MEHAFLLAHNIWQVLAGVSEPDPSQFGLTTEEERSSCLNHPQVHSGMADFRYLISPCHGAAARVLPGAPSNPGPRGLLSVSPAARLSARLVAMLDALHPEFPIACATSCSSTAVHWYTCGAVASGGSGHRVAGKCGHPAVRWRRLPARHQRVPGGRLPAQHARRCISSPSCPRVH